MLWTLQDGLTALLRAASVGHSGLVGLLLDRGADVEAKDNVSRPPAFSEPQRRSTRGSLARCDSAGLGDAAWCERISDDHGNRGAVCARVGSVRAWPRGPGGGGEHADGKGCRAESASLWPVGEGCLGPQCRVYGVFVGSEWRVWDRVELSSDVFGPRERSSGPGRRPWYMLTGEFAWKVGVALSHGCTFRCDVCQLYWACCGHRRMA